MTVDIDSPPHMPEAGTVLREAREKRGLSISAVAEALHLRPEIVDALEAERFDSLPPRTFVRGYLRSYAKLLEVDEDAVLVAFDRCLPEEAPAALASRDLTARRGDVSRWLVGAGGALAVAAALYVWSAGAPAPELPSATASPSGSVEQHGETAAAREGAAPEPTVTTAAVSPSIAELSAAVAPVVTEEAGEPASEPTETPAAAAAAEPGPQAGVANEPVVQTAAPDPAIAEVRAPVASAEAEPAPPAAAVSSISLRIEGESWVEVTDGNGRRRYVGLVQGPRELTFDGAKPYSLVLGNAAGIQLRFEGETVDLAPHTRGKVARLTLPQ